MCVPLTDTVCVCVCVCRWFEQDPEELVASVKQCLEEVGQRQGGEGGQRLRAVGITNQRETTVVWDKATGKSLHSAIGKEGWEREICLQPLLPLPQCGVMAVLLS